MGKLSDFPLKEYVDKGFTTLVETGSGTGTGIDTARGYAFEKIYSTELIKSQAISLMHRYIPDERVHIYNDESPIFLHALCGFQIADDKCVFWLDAHYPGADLGHNDYDHEKDLLRRLPLERELEMLLKHKRHHDIIICDDLRIYQKCPMEGGDLEACGLGHITRYDAPDFLAPWRETHNVEKIYKDTGYILMTPKSL